MYKKTRCKASTGVFVYNYTNIRSNDQPAFWFAFTLWEILWIKRNFRSNPMLQRVYLFRSKTHQKKNKFNNKPPDLDLVSFSWPLNAESARLSKEGFESSLFEVKALQVVQNLLNVTFTKIWFRFNSPDLPVVGTDVESTRVYTQTSMKPERHWWRAFLQKGILFLQLYLRRPLMKSWRPGKLSWTTIFHSSCRVKINRGVLVQLLLAVKPVYCC